MALSGDKAETAKKSDEVNTDGTTDQTKRSTQGHRSLFDLMAEASKSSPLISFS